MSGDPVARAAELPKAVRVGALKRELARLERGGTAGHSGRTPHCVTLGVPDCDRALPHGGLKAGGLHEVCASDVRDRWSALGFLLSLTVRASQARPGPVLWCRPGHMSQETGALYGPGLKAFGLDPARLVLVSAPRGNDVLWALEEAARTRGLAAVVGEVATPGFDLTASRRLQLAAESAGTPVLINRDQMIAGASAALTRWRIAASPSPPAAYDARAPGAPCWKVSLERVKGGRPHDWEMVWDDETFSFRLVAPLADRPPAAAGGSIPSLPLAGEDGKRRLSG